MIAASHIDLLRVIRAPGTKSIGIESHAVLRFGVSIGVPSMPYNSTQRPISTSSCAFFQHVACPQRLTAVAAQTSTGLQAGRLLHCDSSARFRFLGCRGFGSECEIDIAGG